jgi:hypothetical protein
MARLSEAFVDSAAFFLPVSTKIESIGSDHLYCRWMSPESGQLQKLIQKLTIKEVAKSFCIGENSLFCKRMRLLRSVAEQVPLR